ncbi:hypothetical protein [Halorhabdus amylolytica]|nr:hypothetical protein [Halorhabdus amylolytica]
MSETTTTAIHAMSRTPSTVSRHPPTAGGATPTAPTTAGSGGETK